MTRPKFSTFAPVRVVKVDSLVIDFKNMKNLEPYDVVFNDEHVTIVRDGDKISILGDVGDGDT